MLSLSPRITLFILCGMLALPAQGTFLVRRKNSLHEDKTFDFPIQAFVAPRAGDIIVVGAHPSVAHAGIAKEFALTAIEYGNSICVPIAQETVTLDEVPDQKNPLYDAGFIHLDLLGTQADLTFMEQAQGKQVNNSILAVTSKDPSTLYFIQNQAGHTIYQVKDIKDAHGKVTAGIVKIMGTLGNRPFATLAVKNAEGEFGKSGSGIALINFAKITEGTGRVKELSVTQIDPQAAQANTPRAFPLDISTAAARIQNDLSAMGSVVDMYWDSVLSRLYITLHVTAGGALGDGARALLVAGFEETGIMHMGPMAPDAFFTNNNHIIGARGAGESVSLHKVLTFWTSTRLPYLIVVGGNGTPDETRNQMYALPIHRESGLLATKDGTSFAVTQEDSYTTDATLENAAAHVGGGPLMAGPIAQCYQQNDTVCVLVSHPAKNQIAGVYYSQALFNPQGRIKTWTNWQRLTRFNRSVFGVAFDGTVSNILALSGQDKDQIDTITGTVWGAGNKNGLEPLNTLLKTHLPVQKGGIQGLFEFPHRITPGLSHTSLLIATGFNTVLSIETDYEDENGVHHLTNGSDFENRDRLSLFSGAHLAAIGAVSSAEIAYDELGKGGLLFAGGSKGLAVLSDADGNGWQDDSSHSFTSLIKTMSFKKIGNYSLIRKLIADEHFLYVLTKTSLDRIALNALHAPATTIAHITDFTKGSGTFHDAIVSRGCIILATSHGLFKTDNQQSSWSTIPVPGNSQSVYRLSARSTTGRDQDVACGVGGMIYTLSGTRSSNSSCFSRFALTPTATDIELSPLADVVIKNKLYPWITFDSFKEYCVTNGAACLHAAARDITKDPMLTAGFKRAFIRMPLAFKTASHMTCALQSGTLGSWIIAGDFGITVNE